MSGDSGTFVARLRTANQYIPDNVKLHDLLDSASQRKSSTLTAESYAIRVASLCFDRALTLHKALASPRGGRSNHMNRRYMLFVSIALIGVTGAECHMPHPAFLSGR
jgi:hypothetical protein